MPSTSNSPKDDTASTYMVQNSKKKEEVQRLVLQSRIFSKVTGGVLSEQLNADTFRRVLDVACGTGDWLIEAAQAYPEMRLVGVDINPSMIDYASKQAQVQGVADRIEFQVMDILKGLDFPDNSFDLVNLRFGGSFVRTWEWPPLLLEMQRVVRPSGIIRWGENEMGAEVTSPALTNLFDIGMGAFYRAGYIFTPDAKGLTGHMTELLTNSWCENVQAKTYSIPFRAGMPEREMYIDDVKYLYVTVTPFYQKWGGLPENYDALYRQALEEMGRPDFSITWPHVIAWGSKPAKSYASTRFSAPSRREKERSGTTSSPQSSRDDTASTYMAQSSKKKEELLRLVLQSHMITEATGGVLPEQPGASTLRRVLDVACGTGGWVLDTARAYPQMSLVGIDISVLMTDYARVQAKEQGLTGRVEFQVMDALKKIDFPDNSFDLVNLRFGVSFVRTWDWPPLLLEMQRVVRPGGVIRLGESEIVTLNTSRALTELYDLVVRAFYRAGHIFAQDTTGLTGHLAELLTKSWCENVQEKTYPLLFRAGTPEGNMYIDDVKYLHITTTSFLEKWVGLPDNYEPLYQQALKDMKQPDFSALWPHHIVWGQKPLTI